MYLAEILYKEKLLLIHYLAELQIAQQRLSAWFFSFIYKFSK